MSRSQSHIPQRYRVAVYGTLVALLLSACGEDEAREASKPAAETRLELRQPSGESVATVNGANVTREQLDAAMVRQPGLDAETALAQLIELELLAQEAVRRDLDKRWEVQVAGHRALVQRFLETRVEEESAPEDVEAAVVRGAYDNYAVHFFQPELATVSHLLIALPEDVRTEQDMKLALAMAEKIAAHLRTSRTPVRSLESLVLETSLYGFVTHVDHDLTFAQEPVAPMIGQKPRFITVVEAFADASFALTAQDRVSDPVITVFGVHIIVLHRKTPAVRPPFETVESVIRTEFSKRLRVRRLDNVLKRIFRDARVETDEDPIKALGQRTNL